MHAETIAIGTELTTGAKLDTNSQWLSVELAAVGIPVQFHTTVADDLDANCQVLRNALDRVDLILITGGLGPTLDDLTREALANVLGVELVLDPESLTHIEQFFAHRKRAMPERNRIQAYFPKGSQPIPNPRGTAPGIWLEFPRPGRESAWVVCMPGVPSEMKPMFREWVLPRVLARGGTGRCLRSARVNCFGLGESHAEELLGELTARGRDPEVGITVHEATITLRIEAHGATPEECQTKIEQAKLAAQAALGDYVFGEDDDELQDIVAMRLMKRGETLAYLDAGSAGRLANWLASLPLAQSAACLGGLTGAAEWLSQRLGLEEAGTSPNLTERWAAAGRELFQTDYVLAIGAVVPDERGIEHIPVTLATKRGCQSLDIIGTADPAILRSRAAKSALNLLRLDLIKGP